MKMADAHTTITNGEARIERDGLPQTASQKDQHMSSLAIDDFIQNWESERPLYEEFAKRIESVCTDELDKLGIRYRTSSRAKPKKSMRGSIERRQQVRERWENKLNKTTDIPYIYQDEPSIRRDLIDLAGVRVIISNPDDSKVVQEMIQRVFDPWLAPWGETPETHLKNSVNSFSRVRGDVKTTIREGKTLEGAQDWPLGYTAVHLRCKLKTSRTSGYEKHFGTEQQCCITEKGGPQLTTQNKHKDFQNFAVEIQIGTAMMYAWADEFHDIAYKRSIGEALPEEMTLLNILNSLAHTGELALKQLYASLRLRQIAEITSFPPPIKLPNAL